MNDQATTTPNIPDEQLFTTNAGKVILRVERKNSPEGFPIVFVYKPKAKKAHLRYRFVNVANREAYIEEQVKQAQAHEIFLVSKRATRVDFRHGYKVGDLLVSTWGYDQTNVDFYQIVKTTEKTITFAPIASESVAKDRWGQSGSVKPAKDKFKGEPTTRTVFPGSKPEDKGRIPFSSYQYLREVEADRSYAWSSDH